MRLASLLGVAVGLVWVLVSLTALVDGGDHDADDDGLLYMVTIDGGSSGSRVHVHLVGIQHDSPVLPAIKSKVTHKVKPGLSSYASDPAKAAQSIRELLEHALDNVPQSYWRKTPVFLKATAGLRSVTQAQASEILEHCTEVIARTAFHFQPEWASVISGKEEGTFGWISANYLMGRLNSQANANLGPIGVIEMGGASMQVSFIPHPTEKVDQRVILPVSIGGQEYPLYTHSFLGYGLDQALDRFEASIGSASPNPCIPETSRAADFNQCMALMPPLLQLDQCPALDTCSLNGVYSPSADGIEFVAIENFFYTSDFFDVAHSPEKLYATAQEWCHKDLKALSEKFTKDPPEDAAKRCFSAAYIHSILTKGFKISDTFSNIKFVREIDGVGIDWAIGSVLVEALRLQAIRKAAGGTQEIMALPAPESTNRFPLTDIWIFVLPVAILITAFFLVRNKTKRGPIRYAPIGSSRGLPML